MSTTITAEVIVDTLKGWVANKTPVEPQTWLDAALKLSTLMGDEEVKYAEMFMKVAQRKAEHIAEGATAAKARILVEATDDYKQLYILKARINQIDEMIKCAKLYARMTNDEISRQFPS